MTKQKPWQHKTASVKWKIRQIRQNKKTTAKLKSHGKTKKQRRNKKVTEKQKSYGKNKKATAKKKKKKKTKAATAK